MAERTHERPALAPAGASAAPSLAPEAVRSRLVAVLAAAIAEDVRQYPEGPPAEASATSGTASNRRRPERIVYGRLHG
jgi:hypothetical protein